MEARELIMQVLTAGIQLVILITFAYAISFLKSRLGEQKTKEYYLFAKQIVSAAEQIFGDGKGKDKKVYAKHFLKEKIGHKLTDDEIEQLIESAVFEMNHVLEKEKLKSE